MSASSERGYAMFLAVAVIASLTFVLLATARVQADMATGIARLQTEGEQAIAAETITARIAFLLTTEQIGPRSLRIANARGGVQELRLDGRPYAVGTAGQAAVVSIQDEAGLLNLNAEDEGALAFLLKGIGLEERRARRLAGVLADYTDGDNLERLWGAEERAYRRGAGPANQPLLTRWQALEALGWGAALSQQRRVSLWELSAVAPPLAALNVNTAPAPVLEAVLGDAAAADALLARREASAILDNEELETLTVGRRSAAGSSLATAAGPAFRLTIAFEHGAAGRWIERRLILAASASERPVTIVDEQSGPLAARGGRNRERQGEPLPTYASGPAS